MTAMAERVIEEIRGLPPAALREVCEAVNRLAAGRTKDESRFQR